MFFTDNDQNYLCAVHRAMITFSPVLNRHPNNRNVFIGGTITTTEILERNIFCEEEYEYGWREIRQKKGKLFK